MRASRAAVVSGARALGIICERLTKPTANLPVVIANFALTAYDDWRRLAWTAALLITATVLVVTMSARIILRGNTRS